MRGILVHMTFDPVLTPTALHASFDDFVLLDARSGVGAREKFLASHLRGACWVDLETDLATKREGEGRHPLPTIEEFAKTLARKGVSPSSRVCVYDDQLGANAAARCWWMLRQLGIEAYVLEGGWPAAQALPMASGEEPDASLEASSWPLLDAQTVSIDRVDRARASADWRVIDVRANARFSGESEPIDPVAGHVPGAINVPLSENMTREGRFLDRAALRAKYEAIIGDVPMENVIVHCGSGVTACHTLLALERAGLHGARLWVGSFSQWCREPARPIGRTIRGSIAG